MFVFSLFIFQHFVASCCFGNCTHCSYFDMKRLFPPSVTSIRKTLFFLAAATSSFTCREFMAKGFSHSTFFPASRNSRPTLQCSMCSTPTYTMSVKDADVAQSALKSNVNCSDSPPSTHPNFIVCTILVAQAHRCLGLWPEPRSCRKPSECRAFWQTPRLVPSSSTQRRLSV